MFGLFDCSYDYYEWKDLVCVSKDLQVLRDYTTDKPYPLADNEADHEKLADQECRHFYICEVTEI